MVVHQNFYLALTTYAEQIPDKYNILHLLNVINFEIASEGIIELVLH